jgi:choline monooxygenase
LNGAALSTILSAYDDEAPLELASTLPAAWYTDPRILELERERIFGSEWQVAGRTDQVEHNGRYFTVEIAGEPLVIVRGSDGVLRGFFNVCRHHAAAVATRAEGNTQLFRCPYHGWTYGLDGSLKGTPDFTGVCSFERGSNGLVPVRVAVWEQFVFVSLSASGPSLQDHLADLPTRIEPLALSALRFHSRREYTLACNWKVYVDNYLDGGYHVPYLHKGLNSVLDYAHYTIENAERYCLQSSPIAGARDEFGATRTGERADYYWLFPNFMINIYEGVMDTNLVLPLAIDRTRVIFDFYFSASAGVNSEDSVAVSDVVQQEDVAVCEAVQRGLSSRAYGAGRLSVRREAGEHLFHRLLAQKIRD